MSSKTLKQLAILGALGAGLVVVLMFQGGESTPAGTAARPSNRVSGTTGTRQKPGADQVAVVDIQLEALKAPREDAPTPERNLFRFEVKAPPPQQARAPVAPPSTIAQPVTPRVPVPTGPPPPPPIPLRFIGVLNAPTQAGRVAVLTDGRGASLMGREGDIIEGRYRLLRIGPDAVEMAYTDGRGRQVIRLSGQ
jgi:hypothetical protein